MSLFRIILILLAFYVMAEFFWPERSETIYTMHVIDTVLTKPFSGGNVA